MTDGYIDLDGTGDRAPTTAEMLAAANGVRAALFKIPLGDYIVMGDSLDAEGGAGAGQSAAKRVITKSDGRYVQRANYAVGGKTTADMISEQLPSALASPVANVLMGGATNDLGPPVSEATIRANILTMWTQLTAAGKRVFDHGPLPNNGAGSVRATRHADHELWRQMAARRLGIPHANLFILGAQADGKFISGYNQYVSAGTLDDTHPSGTFEEIMANAYVAMMDNPNQLAPLLELIDRAAGATVIFPNAVSFGGVASALPSGYVTIGSGGTYSVVVDGGGAQQNWLRCTLPTSGTGVGFSGTGRSLASLGWSAGDRVAFGCRLRWSGTADASFPDRSGVQPTIAINNTGVTTTIALPFNEVQSPTGGDMTVYGEATLGNASVNVNFQASTTNGGYFEITRPILYNLTLNQIAP